MGAGLGCLATPLLLYLAICTPPPGRGLVAETRYREASTINGALERFRRAYGAYPDSLRPLLDLPGTDRLERTDLRQTVSHFSYRRNERGYVLRFEYFGPGKNDCEFTSADHRWSCGGLY